MPVHQTRGAKSAEAFGFGAGAAKVVTPGPYIEQLFCNYLYVGTGATQTITNNLALSTNGGMVWIKDRTNAYNHNLFSTTQTATKALNSNTTNALTTDANSLTAFGTTGFTLGSGATSGTQVNVSGDKYVSWSFCKQAKFFDIQTYTGNGSTQTISHVLSATPGCIMVKRTDTAGSNWAVYHIGQNAGVTPQNYYSLLNSTATPAASSAYWNNTAPTSANFTVGSSADVNTSGGTYIAYIFSAGGTAGFGATGSQDVISCGFVTTNSSGNASVTLGFEPQCLIVKNTSATGNWYSMDILRLMSTLYNYQIYPNLSNADTQQPGNVIPNATGFSFANGGLTSATSTLMYIAIRRAPQAVPTVPTKVFAPVLETTTTVPQTVTAGFPVDVTWSSYPQGGANKSFIDRLRGSITTSGYWIDSFVNSGDSLGTQIVGFDSSTGFVDNNWNCVVNGVWWCFVRAPSFLDEVLYSGTGSVTTISHGLNAVPQLMFVKARLPTVTGNWMVYSSLLGNTQYLNLNSTAAAATSSTVWNNTSPTSSVFTIGTDSNVNNSTYSFMAYLFATTAGVSYVGSYTGTGGTQAIACGFSGGARFLLAKRTDSTSSWCLWDSASGFTSSSSPYYPMETNATTQVTGNNGTYASTGGFTVTSTSPVNVSGGTYIFLAIA
jgi:hypothetical protein